MAKKLINTLLFLLMTKVLIGQTYTLDLQPISGNGIEANVQRINPDMNLGEENVLRFSSSGGMVERALLKFDVSGIPPGVDILSANLILYGVSHRVAVAGDGILQLVAYPWDENTVTWNVSSIFEDNMMPEVHLSAPIGGSDSYTLDVADMVQKMVNTPLINFGWMLKIEDESGMTDESYSFGSSSNTDNYLAPELIIMYCNHLSVKAFASAATSTTDANAAVYLDVSGGVPPFSYAWSSSATTKDLYNITPGLYTVTVTDTRGFSSAKIITIPGSCGSLTMTVLNAPGSYGNARVINQSFNDNTANSNDLSATELEAYNLPDDDGQSVARSMFAFDLSSLPDNVVVTSATLRLTDDESPLASSYTLQLCRVNETWNERTATYNNLPLYNSSSEDVKEFSYDATSTYYDIDVSAQLQDMISTGTSTQGWLLKLKNESLAAAGGSAKFAGSQLYLVLAMPTFACDDSQLNWNQTDTYDETGATISSQKSYLDNLGRLTQKLVKNAAGEVFRTQTVYDSYGYSAVKSMPAFSGTVLTYQTNFMMNVSGQPFSYLDFDQPTTLNNNSVLQNGITNSLGYYYSDLNSYDAYQATTGNPYARTQSLGGGSVAKVSSPGNAYKMGSGHETMTFNMVSGDELVYFFGKHSVFNVPLSYKAVVSNTDVLNSDPIIGTIMASKQVVVTPDNPDFITYTVGDKVIATCYSGLSSGETYTNMTNVNNVMSYTGTNCTDIHLPYADRNSLSFPVPAAFSASLTFTGLQDIDYYITDLYTDKLLVAGTDYVIGSARTLTFTTGYLNQYTNKSLFLRIRFQFSTSCLAAMVSSGSSPQDVYIQHSLSYGRASKNYYDLGNNLRKSVSPKGFNIATPTTYSMVTTYDYSHLGQLIGIKSPDQGLVEMVYNKEGNLRFSQNAVQKANNYFSYINYDKHGRPYESGENRPVSTPQSIWFYNYYLQGTGTSWSFVIVDDQDGIRAIDKAEVTLTSYTIPASADDIPSGYSYKSQYTSFRNGQVNFIRNANSTVWYTYDRLDRPLATITQVTEPDFVAKKSNINDQVKTSEGTYDYFTGINNTSTYQTNNSNESLYYQFSYDVNYRPVQTRLTYGGTTYTLNASSYNKMGRLKRTVIGKNFQGVDYVYTLNGALKAINHPGLDATLDPGADNGNYSGSGTAVNKDLFGEIVDFYQDDYLRSNTHIVSSIVSGSKYDGLIYAKRFKTQNVVNTTTTGANYINYPTNSTSPIITSTNYGQQELRNEYTYDEFNQLATSIFETYNNSSNAVTTQFSDYMESGASAGDITYDRNGNITRLVRAAHSSVTLDNLTYTIGATNNQVTDILDAASNSYGQSVNFKTASTSASSPFNYNAIGQMTASTSENISSIIYFPSGKIKKITFSNSNTTEFEYGAMGEKLKSKCYDYSAAKYKYNWYIGPYVYELDEAGTNTFVIKEARVAGGVIRVSNSANVSSGYLVYTLTDHLGNVRVSFTEKTSGNTNGTGIDILSYNDYYTFGGQLPGRSYSSENYRYGYQGQEKAEDGTIWDQFELRSYNHDLGRWFAPDPYGQFVSPYIAMANNPVSGTDADGGMVNEFQRANGTDFGYKQDKWDRDHHTGAYSAENAQKRYDMYYKDLRDDYLLQSDDYLGEARDPAKFLEAMQELNSYFGGLEINSAVGLQTGDEYLSRSEVSLNLDAVKALGLTLPGRTDRVRDDDSQERANDANSYEDGGASSGARANSAATIDNGSNGGWTAVNDIMNGNGVSTGHVAVINHSSDGSETIVEYDTNGEKREDGSPAIDHISFLSSDDVNRRNSRVAGSSFDTRTYGNVGDGFMGSATGNLGHSSSTQSGGLDKVLEWGGRANDVADAIGKASMIGTGKAIGKVTVPVGFAIGAVQIAKGVHEDGNKFGHNAQKATGGFLGGLAGAWAGFEAGASLGLEAGFSIGAIFVGVGAFPGAVIGGVVGGVTGAIGGAYYGAQFGESLIKH